MKEKSLFTTEKPIDYTQSKDAYEGNRESAVAKDSIPDNKQATKDKAK